MDRSEAAKRAATQTTTTMSSRARDSRQARVSTRNGDEKGSACVRASGAVDKRDSSLVLVAEADGVLLACGRMLLGGAPASEGLLTYVERPERRSTAWT